MIRTLYTSSSGLRANQRYLDVVGNNLANVNTQGFKTQRVRFSDQFSETLRAHTLPNGTLGGTNPIQIGNGVKVAATDTSFGQGSIEQTGNDLDLAVQGNGFFVVNDGVQDLYTRVGAFSVDSAGYLVDSSTGFRVQRTGVVGEASGNLLGFQASGDNDIRVPEGQTIPGDATSSVRFVGNLNANAVGPQRQTLAINQPLTVGGIAVTLSADLNQLDQTSSAFVAGDVIQITGTDLSGANVNAQFIYGPGNSTIGDLIDRFNAAFGTVSTGGVVANAQTDGSPSGATLTLNTEGTLTLKANRAGPGHLTFNLSTTDSSALTGNTSFSNFAETVAGKFGDTATTAIDVFDEQGDAHTLTFTFRKQESNSWDLISAVSDDATFFTRDAFVQGITFNADGSFQSITGQDATEVLATTRPLTANNAGGVAVAAADPLNPAASTLINDLAQTVVPYAGGPNDRIFITGTNADGTEILPPGELAVTATTTVLDLINQINATIQGASAELVAGNIVLRADNPGSAELSLRLSSDTAGGRTLFDDFSVAVDGTDGDDNIQFEVKNLANVGTPQTVHFDFGLANEFNGGTQFGGFNSVTARSQDGFGPGTLVSKSVSSDGTVNGVFSNGKSVALAQLAIATFANPQSLDRVADNYFSDNGNSGPANVAPALTNGAGSIKNSSLEASNVDISYEFTRLITAQRGFQVNARAFSTADNVLEEAVNLVR